MSAATTTLSGMDEELPTEEEAWAAFFEALAPHLVQLHKDGKLPAKYFEPPEPPPAE